MVIAGQSHGCGTAQKIFKQIFKKIFFGWDGDGRAKPCLWHFSEKYSKKYLFDRVVMTTHNHGCGTAQKNIQTNICWMMVMAGQSNGCDTAQQNIQRNILWIGW